MSRKNWDRFFPPTLENVATKQGPGLVRWLLAVFFVCGATGAVVVVKVHKPEEPPALAPSDPGATAENSDVLEAPKPIDDGPADSPAVAEPAVTIKARSIISAEPIIDVTPTPPVTPPSSAVPPTVSDVMPTARLMPPEQPKVVEALPVSHQVARPNCFEDTPKDSAPYRVSGTNETLWEIAKKMLGSGERWMEIARLNPDVDAKVPLPIGTVLRMPDDAVRTEEPVASAPPSRETWAAIEAATRVVLAATNAVVALPGMNPPELQRATLVDAQPAPPSAEPPQALHNEGSTPPAASKVNDAPPAAQPQATPPSPEPLAPPSSVSAPQAAPPSPPTTLPQSGPPPAPPVAVAPNPPPPAVNPPTSVKEPVAALPLPVLVPSVPKAHIEAPAPTLPITGTFVCACAGAEVHLPSKLVQQAGDHGILYVALGPDQQSIWVYTTAALEQLNEQLQHLPGGDDHVQRCRRLCYSRFEMVEISTGKPAVSIKLSAELAEAIGLDDKAVIIGARDHYELWDAQRWQQYCKTGAMP